MDLKQVKRLVIKIGSSTIVREDKSLRENWLSTLAYDIAELKKQGISCIIVSSGAVAAGREVFDHETLTIEQKQAAFAVGQINLMAAYKKAFSNHDTEIGQILLTLEDTESRRKYINCTNTLETLIARNVVPIINENDAVATSELRYGDNDRLSTRIALMAQSEMLFLLSDIDGLYTANPKIDSTAQRIEVVDEVTEELLDMASSLTNDYGSGGMKSKLQAAQMATAAGTSCIITNGGVDRPITSFLSGKTKGTLFKAKDNVSTARKSWIIGGLDPKGEIEVDNGAMYALNAGKSLLAAGIISIKGQFEKGDLIEVVNQGKVIGKGICRFSSEEVDKVKRKQSSKIAETLGFEGRTEIIHTNDLAMDLSTEHSAETNAD